MPWWRSGWRPGLAWTVIGLLLLAFVIPRIDFDGSDSGGDSATDSGSAGQAADMRATTDIADHTDAVNALAFSPDNTKLASASDDKSVRIWGVPYGGTLGELRGHTDRVLAVRFNGDGRTLMSADAGGAVFTWDLTTKQPVTSVKSNVTVDGALAFSSDGTLAAASTQGGFVTVWTVATGDKVLSPPASGGRIDALAFSPDGKLLAGARNDGTLLVWRIPSGKLVSLRENPGGGLLGVAFSPDSQTVVVGGHNRQVRLWSTSPENGASVVVAEHSYPVYGLAFNASGTLLLSADSGGTVRVRDKLAAVGMSGSPQAGGDTAARPATTSSTGTGISDAQTSNPGGVTQAHPVDHLGYTNPVRCVAFSPDGTKFAVGGGRYLSIWKLP
ncbi:hypothetical protein GCM10009558_061280 [Virgisporangium aurantiacum]